MSLAEVVDKAKAQLADAQVKLVSCDDSKQRAQYRRDIAELHRMIQRAEGWLESTNTGGQNGLESQGRNNQ